MQTRPAQKLHDTHLDRAVDRVKELRGRGKRHPQAVSITASEFGLKFDVLQRELSRRAATRRAAKGRRMPSRPVATVPPDERPLFPALGALPAGDR